MKKYCFTIAICALTFFVGVMVLHPFATHHHEHSIFEKNSLEFIHTGPVERNPVGAMLPIVLFEVFALCFLVMRFQHALVQRGFQHIDIPILLALQSALRSGVLNTKRY